MAKLGAECTESRSLLPLLVRSTVAVLMRPNAADLPVIALAAVGREDGTPDATEKLNAELFFQQLHLMTDGRRGQVQSFAAATKLPRRTAASKALRH